MEEIKTRSDLIKKKADDIRGKTEDEIIDFLAWAPGHSHEIAAQAEMMRRLIIAIKDFNKKSSNYTKVLIVLTIIIAILTGAMIFTK